MNNKKINVSIEEGQTFFANEISVNFNPIQFFLDFKSVSPRVDIRTKENEMNLRVEHNVIAIDPFHAKKVFETLKQGIENYEKEFGEIKKPESIQKLEEKQKQQGEDQNKMAEKTPIYFG